jgi:hypothetical protein
MQAELKTLTLRNAKAQAEATADKLQTEFALHLQEIEAQLLSLSSENDRLKEYVDQTSSRVESRQRKG